MKAKTTSVAIALVAAFLLAACAAPQSHHTREQDSRDKVTLQLKWRIQTQFAGYYVALDKGFYDQENLDVTILPGGPGIATPEVLARGEADVIVDWMPSALAAREGGVPLVHIAQPFAASALMLVCRRDRGITSPVHFRGKRIGVWFAGNEYPFLGWMNRLGFPVDGSAEGVEMLEQGGDVGLLTGGQADCVSQLTYGFRQFEEAGISDDDLIVFRYEHQGVSVLEDGLYALEDDLADAAFADKMARFVRASMRGWRYAEEHQSEAVEIVLAYDAEAHAAEAHEGEKFDWSSKRASQEYMMREIAELTRGSDGALNVADYWRTVNIMLNSGPKPVLEDFPNGAWTREITDRALQ